MKISRWLLLGVSHRYWNFTVAITNCQQFPNIRLTNGNASFFFNVYVVFPLSSTMLSPGFTISNMAGAIEKQELLNLREHMWSPCCSYFYFSVLCVLSFFLIVLCLVSSVAYVYGLSSLVCDRSVSCIQCCLCLWIVQSCLWSFCSLYPVLSMSMDWPVLFVTGLYLVSSVACVYGLSSLVCDRSVSCTQCCQCLNCPVLFVIVLCLVPSVVNVYGLTSLVCDRSVFCVRCCLCLWIVQSCLWPLCILYPVLPMSMDWPVLFVIVLCLVPSVANVYGLSSLLCNRSVSCAQCCQCLWIVQSVCDLVLYPVLSMSMNCPVLFVMVLCLVPSVANVYGLSSLVCDRSVSCAKCCQCLWIVQSCL